MENTENKKTPYELLGGETPLRALVDSFYDHMDDLVETKPIREMHPKNLRGSREKLFMFLSGWLGGPDRYIAAFGHPRLRRRHMPFSIGPKERDQWMHCMKLAFDELDVEADLKQHLLSSLEQTATHMINQAE